MQQIVDQPQRSQKILTGVLITGITIAVIALIVTVIINIVFSKINNGETFTTNDTLLIQQKQNRVNQGIEGQTLVNQRALLSGMPDSTITTDDPKFNPLLASQTDEVIPYDYNDIKGTEYDKSALPITAVFNVDNTILPQTTEVDNVIMSQDMGGEMENELVQPITDYGKLVSLKVDNKVFADDDGQNIPADKKQDISELEQYKQSPKRYKKI